MNNRKIFIFIFFLFSSQFSFSQWHGVLSNTNNNLVDICFVSDSIGYVVSGNGEVLKTIDQGETWNLLITLNGIFTSICSVGRDTVFVGGNNIYRSTNGGNTWNLIISLPFTTQDFEFFDSKRGIYIKPHYYDCNSSQGTVTIESYEAYNTVDSGFTWNLAFDHLRPLSRFQRVNDSVIFIVGGQYAIWDHCNGSYSNRIIESRDFGNTWVESFQNGFTFCNISRINDSCQYQNYSAYGLGNSLYRLKNNVDSFVRPMNFVPQQMIFINMINGYLLYNNRVYYTTAEGAVWLVDTTVSVTINKIYNNSKINMFAIGQNGLIIKKGIIESLFPDTIYYAGSSRDTINFKPVMVGAFKVIPVTITNEGNTNLNATLQVNAPYQISFNDSNYFSSVSLPMLSLEDTLLYVKFIPTDTISYYDSLLITAPNAQDLRIPIYGRGTNDLAGRLSTTLNICQDTIKVIEDFVINKSGKLIICPGTTVLFMNHFNLDVYGTLIALGLQNDSIRFTPIDTAIGWNGIQFLDSTADTSLLRHCIIHYAKKFEGYSTSGGGINIFKKSNLIVDSSTISYNQVGGYGGGIFIQSSSPIIRANKIYNNTAKIYGGGIEVSYSSSLIVSNEIYNNRAYYTEGGGIMISNDGSMQTNIIQNIIFNNTATYSGGGISCYGNFNIINNTICNNSTNGEYAGIFCDFNFANGHLLNNILYNNVPDQMHPNVNTPISFSDIQDYLGGGSGNISQAPYFVNSTDSIGNMVNIGTYDWSLTNISPCINTGDPSPNLLIPNLDIAGNPRILLNRIDMGAYEFNGVIGINEITGLSNVVVYPNPFTEQVNFRISNYLNSEITIYDISSRVIFKSSFSHQLFINTKNFARGVYFYEIFNKDGLIKKGLITKG